MADTLPNIDLPTGVPVDLYAATGIGVGTQINVQNLGVKEVYVVAQAANPGTDLSKYRIVQRAGSAVNDFGDAGAWAISPYCAGKVNVREE